MNCSHRFSRHNGSAAQPRAARESRHERKRTAVAVRTGPNGDPWPWHLEIVEQIVKALPRKTAALASPVLPFPQSPHRLFVKLFQPIAVARHPIVVVITTELVGSLTVCRAVVRFSSPFQLRNPQGLDSAE